VIRCDRFGNDYTVIGTFALTPGNELLVYDALRIKVKIPQLHPLMTAQRLKYENRLSKRGVSDARRLAHGLLEPLLLKVTQHDGVSPWRN